MRTSGLVFAIPGDPEQRTGGYIYDRRVAEALARRGWNVTPLRLPGGFPDPSAEELATTARALAGVADGSLVLVDGLAFAVMPEIALAERERLRLVALVHHPLAYETGLAPAAVERLRACERQALTAARRVVVTSEATRTTLIDDFAVPPARITVAVPGTDPQPPAQGSGGRKLQLLAVGSVIPRKDFPTLVEALAGLAPLPWRLTIVGSLERSREEAARLRAAIERHGLAGRVVLEGELTAEELGRAYDRADVLVSVSRYEGFGMALAEGIARGLPIVAVVGGAVAGWLPEPAAIRVPPDDPDALRAALAAVIGDPARRAELRAGALAAREALPGWDDTAAAVETALSEAWRHELLRRLAGPARALRRHRPRSGPRAPARRLGRGARALDDRRSGQRHRLEPALARSPPAGAAALAAGRARPRPRRRGLGRAARGGRPGRTSSPTCATIWRP